MLRVDAPEEEQWSTVEYSGAVTPPARPPRSALPPFWPGLLLNLLLPGSGFTYLGRPLLHLWTLILTLALWAACWLLMLYVADSGWPQGAALAQAGAGDLTILVFLLVFSWYAALTRLYVRTYRALSQSPASAHVLPLLKVLLIGVQAGAPIWLVLQNPMFFIW